MRMGNLVCLGHSSIPLRMTGLGTQKVLGQKMSLLVPPLDGEGPEKEASTL